VLGDARRLALLPLLTALALGCAHAPPPLQAPPLSRKDATALHSLEEVPLGRYRAVYGGAGAGTLERSDEALVFKHDEGSAVQRLRLQPDGTFALPGHYGAWVTRRGDTTLLTMAYAYQYVVYEFMGR
jgi:hypothetical protein